MIQNSLPRIGKFLFNPIAQTLSVDGNIVANLTKKESKLLEALCENINEVVERKILLLKAWGYATYYVGRSMDVYIVKLKKLLATDATIKITNKHGVGFMLSVNGEALNKDLIDRRAKTMEEINELNALINP